MYFCSSKASKLSTLGAEDPNNALPIFLRRTTVSAPVIDIISVWFKPISLAMSMKRSHMLTVIIADAAAASMKAVTGTSSEGLPWRRRQSSPPIPVESPASKE